MKEEQKQYQSYQDLQAELTRIENEFLDFVKAAIKKTQDGNFKLFIEGQLILIENGKLSASEKPKGFSSQYDQESLSQDDLTILQQLESFYLYFEEISAKIETHKIFWEASKQIQNLETQYQELSEQIKTINIFFLRKPIQSLKDSSELSQGDLRLSLTNSKFVEQEGDASTEGQFFNQDKAIVNQGINRYEQSCSEQSESLRNEKIKEITEKVSKYNQSLVEAQNKIFQFPTGLTKDLFLKKQVSLVEEVKELISSQKTLEIELQKTTTDNKITFLEKIQIITNQADPVLLDKTEEKCREISAAYDKTLEMLEKVLEQKPSIKTVPSAKATNKFLTRLYKLGESAQEFCEHAYKTSARFSGNFLGQFQKGIEQIEAHKLKSLQEKITFLQKEEEFFKKDVGAELEKFVTVIGIKEKAKNFEIELNNKITILTMKEALLKSKPFTDLANHGRKYEAKKHSKGELIKRYLQNIKDANDMESLISAIESDPSDPKNQSLTMRKNTGTGFFKLFNKADSTSDLKAKEIKKTAEQLKQNITTYHRLYQ